MAQTKTAVQLHKKGDANALIYANTKAELVELTNGQTLEQKIPSLENIVEVVKIGETALVIGADKTVTIPDFYAKTDADSKFATKDELSAIPKFGIEVVETLPTSNIKNDKIYLVTTGDEEDNLFTEYIRVNNKWEKLGTQKIDISGKQDALSETQLAAANSGVTAEKVAAYDAYATGKQDKLSETQLAAANSGITADKVSTYDGYATTISNKAESSAVDALSQTVEGLDYLEYTIIKNL